MPLGLGGGIAANYGLMARFEHEITSPGLWRDKSSSHSMKKSRIDTRLFIHVPNEAINPLPVEWPISIFPRCQSR
jgi:hypothetical protein